MTTHHTVKKNTYVDSVSLMSISTKANQIEGVTQAFVAMGTPEEVAGAVNFLMSAEAGYITRQVLAVNGGLC